MAAIQELLRRDPADASAFHNLGSVCYRLGQFEESVEAYRESVKLRAENASTYLHLALALKESGKLAEAITACEQAERLAPGDQTVIETLRRLRKQDEKGWCRGLDR
jgi:Flp pilus assembly protein TadD